MSANRILPRRAPVRNPPRFAPPQRRAEAEQSKSSPLRAYYDAILRAYGPQHWWPGRTRFEVIVGAILTQSTSWSNVERAIAELRREKLLSPTAFEQVSTERLSELIRSSGYFRQKARKLKAFVHFLLSEYAGSLDKMFAMPTAELRGQLLSVHGIGPETADSILLYAGGHATFVVDAYTRRMLVRHGLSHEKATYGEIQELFHASLPADAELFNEYHALIVETGKRYCKKGAAECEHCPLRAFLPVAARIPS